MTLGGVRDFFRGRLDALGYREWPDGFNTANIPSTLIDGSYHLEVGTIVGAPTNQHYQQIEFPLTIRLFSKGFRDPGPQIDTALDNAEEILDDLLDSTVRNAQDGMKDIKLNTIRVVPLSVSNDNVIVTEIALDLYMAYCF
jgi:hypothetical protein